jgi:hypothetical protein
MILSPWLLKFQEFSYYRARKIVINFARMPKGKYRIAPVSLINDSSGT